MVLSRSPTSRSTIIPMTTTQDTLLGVRGMPSVNLGLQSAGCLRLCEVCCDGICAHARTLGAVHRTATYTRDAASSGPSDASYPRTAGSAPAALRFGRTRVVLAVLQYHPFWYERCCSITPSGTSDAPASYRVSDLTRVPPEEQRGTHGAGRHEGQITHEVWMPASQVLDG